MITYYLIENLVWIAI